MEWDNLLKHDSKIRNYKKKLGKCCYTYQTWGMGGEKL